MVRNYIRKTDRGMTYSKEKLLEAVAKVRSGELNGYEAANIYSIPRTTLYDYIKGKSKRSLTLGKPPALSPEIEETIAKNLLALEENAFYLGRKEILDLAGLYLNENKISHPFKSGKPGECWLTSFSKRTNVNPKPVYKQFGTQDKDVILVKEFYSILEMRIEKLELADKPAHIWHMEEHSFYKGNRVNCHDKEKDITVVTACSAEGKKAPLLIVFRGEKSHDWMLGKHLHISHNTGMCREVFKTYFSTFLNYIDDTKPNLVIFEAPSSLINLDVVEEARKANVTILKAPSYLETLDISIARSLKLKWSLVFGDTTKEFATLLSQLFDDLNETEIGEDFKNAGIHPFETVCDSKFESDRLKIYEEYKWFKERHLSSIKLNKDTEEVMVNEGSAFRIDFEMEFDSSTSMSMTEEVETPGCSGEMLRRALITVKKELMIHDQIENDKELTKAEEDHLVAWVMDLTKAGFKITEDNLIEAVDNIQGNPSINKPDRHKYECLIRSHPKLKDKLSKKTEEKLTKECINAWLYRVRMYLKKANCGGVLCHPNRIYNFGEAILHLDAEDHVDKSDDITVYVSASADGNVQPPSVLFPFKQTVGSNPWSKAEILNDQITDVFYDWLIEHNIQLPVILFLDQMSDINLSLFEFCKEKQIILLALPSTKIQPLEAVFRPLKRYWDENSQMKKLDGEKIAKALENYVKQDFRKEITNRFKACGIYPFNTNVEYNIEKGIHILESKEKSNQIDLLKEVEKRISSEVLEQFKKTDSWQGDPRHSSLFLFWKNIRDENKGKRQEDRVQTEDKEAENRRTAGDKGKGSAFIEIFVEEVTAPPGYNDLNSFE